MTEPIRSKFDRLDDELAVRHGQLLDKLDDVIAAIGTPQDYTAAFAAQLLALEGISTRLDTTNTLLTTIYNLLPPWALTTTNGYNALLTLRDNSIEMLALAEQVAATIGIAAPGSDFTLATLTQRIAARTLGTWQALGTLGANEPGSALAYLACICEATQEALPADPLDTTAPGSCEEPYTSDGMLLLPWALANGTSQMFASFSTLPPGLSYGTTFSLDDDTAELATGDWSGWSVFVQSDQPQYSDGTGPLSLARFPTNEWRSMDGAGGRAFSVDARGSIKVYLCNDAAAELAEYPNCTYQTANPDLGFGFHRVFNNGDVEQFNVPAKARYVVYGNAASGGSVVVKQNGTTIESVSLSTEYESHNMVTVLVPGAYEVTFQGAGQADVYMRACYPATS